MVVANVGRTTGHYVEFVKMSLGSVGGSAAALGVGIAVDSDNFLAPADDPEGDFFREDPQPSMKSAAAAGLVTLVLFYLAGAGSPERSETWLAPAAFGGAFTTVSLATGWGLPTASSAAQSLAGDSSGPSQPVEPVSRQTQRATRRTRARDGPRSERRMDRERNSWAQTSRSPDSREREMESWA